MTKLLDPAILTVSSSVQSQLNEPINFSSTASKIHITSEVNDELQLIGGFKTEPRGLIDVKVNGYFRIGFDEHWRHDWGCFASLVLSFHVFHEPKSSGNLRKLPWGALKSSRKINFQPHASIYTNFSHDVTLKSST